MFLLYSWLRDTNNLSDVLGLSFPARYDTILFMPNLPVSILSWNPIATAPRDGSVVRTELGLAKWVAGWYDPGWITCTASGEQVTHPAEPRPIWIAPKFWL